jgi:hypothetical protein
VFLDFPLGHTTGKAGDRELQRGILRDALAAFEQMRTPGAVHELPYRWAADDSWKDSAMRPRSSEAGDERVLRFDSPQYQHESDEALARSTECQGCVWPEKSDSED